jgi:hypothetical protein
VKLIYGLEYTLDSDVFSVALYGLLLFYGLTKDELVGKRPLAKFLCIKLIVMATFYQAFVVSLLRCESFVSKTNASHQIPLCEL